MKNNRNPYVLKHAFGKSMAMGGSGSISVL